MADSVVLLDFWCSSYAIRVRIALAEKGVECERKEEEGLFGNKSPLLLQSNPVYKKIPVLIHNGKPICESLIILQYLDEVWTDGLPLLPADPYQRANARFWADFIDKKIADSGTRMWKNKGETKEEAKRELIKCLKLLEGEQGHRSYFGDDCFGFLDIAFIAYACRFYTYEKDGDFDLEEECPKLTEWVKRRMERETPSEALPDPRKVYDAVMAIKKQLGVEQERRKIG